MRRPGPKGQRPKAMDLPNLEEHQPKTRGLRHRPVSIRAPKEVDSWTLGSLAGPTRGSLIETLRCFRHVLNQKVSKGNH